MSSEERQKAGVAYHEAGHVVVALDLDGIVSQVRITRGREEWKGETHAELAKGDDATHAAYYAAGAIAQEKGVPDSAGLYTDQMDVNNLNRLADKQIGGVPLIGPFALPEDKKKRQAFLSKADQTAAAIVEHRWAQVEAVSKALLKSPHLVQDDITRLVGPMNEGQS